MKKSTKIIRLSVTLLLLIAMLLTPMSPVFAVVIENGDADLTAADIVSEDASKREKFSRHYLTGDGTYFAVSYAEQVNYQDDDGNWIAVDNSLSTNVLTGEKSTKNEKFKVKFANKANKEDLVTIKTSEYDVSFGITVSEDGESYLELNKVKGTESASNTSAEPKTTQEATSLGKAVSGITYFDAFSDYLDVRYSVAHEKVKEDLILERKSSFTSYKVTYNIKEKDALATLNDDGSITFTNPDGAVLFNVGVPVMYDSDGKSSADIAVSVTQAKKTVEVIYTPSAEWLNAEDRVYPVTIDPTYIDESYDYFYESLLSQGTSPYEANLSENDGVAIIDQDRSYYLWLTAPTLPSNANVTLVKFLLTIDADDENDDDEDITVEKISGIWFPGEMVYPDGSLAIPNGTDSFNVDIFTSCIEERSPLRLQIYIDNEDISAAGGYENYFGDSYYGHRFTGYGSAQVNIHTSHTTDLTELPCLSVLYEPAIPDGSYYIKNTTTGEYLTVANSDYVPAVGDKFDIASKISNNRYQRFVITYNPTLEAYIIAPFIEANTQDRYLGSHYPLTSGEFTEHEMSIRSTIHYWIINEYGYNTYTIHSNNNLDAVWSTDTSKKLIISHYSQNNVKQLWEFEPYFAQESNEDSTVRFTDTAYLMSVKDDPNSNGYANHDAHGDSVEASLEHGGFRSAIKDKVERPFEDEYSPNRVIEYLENAKIMVISAHGEPDGILLTKSENGWGFYKEHFQNMDLRHIDLLVLLCCSTAYIDDYRSNAYDPDDSNSVITSSDWGASGPRNLFEVFVNCGVQTVIGFNQDVGSDAVTAFAKTFFQLLYNVPVGNQTEGNTPGLSVREVIQTMQISSTTNYQYYAGLFATNSLVIGGSDTMVFDEGDN